MAGRANDARSRDLRTAPPAGRTAGIVTELGVQATGDGNSGRLRQDVKIPPPGNTEFPLISVLKRSSGLRSFRDGFTVPRFRTVAVLALASLAGGCGDGAQPPSTGGGNGNTPAPPTSQRLAWSQAAPSAAAAQSYRFALFLDSIRSMLDGATCAGGSSPFECSAPLPALTPGRHVLELSAIDPATGAESGRSEPLVVGQQAITDTTGETSRQASEQFADVRPFVTCATGDASLCFSVTVAATGLPPVRRLLSLPGARMLMLHENGHITFLPSGISEPLALGRSDPGAVVDVSDVAVDPDFETNRFLYFAAVATAPTGQRRVNVFRARETADRVGEAAMILSLPASPVGQPAISAGFDERLYVAMPAMAGAVPAGRLYDGRLLRFTRDGAAAGNERLASPILATGSSRPMSLVWDAPFRLLIASADGAEPSLRAVALSPDSLSTAWPATAIPVAGADEVSLQSGLRAVAVAPPSTGRTGGATVSIVGTDPAALYIATIPSGTGAGLTSLRHVPLGQFVPATVTFAGPGDILTAGRLGPEGSPVGLLRLRAK